MKNLILILIVAGALCSCNKKSAQNKNESYNITEVSEDVETEDKLIDLKEEELFLKNKNPFGETINLIGEQILGDTAIYKPQEARMFVHNNLLIMKNYANPPFRLFKLPQLMQIKELGTLGEGPEEFRDPKFIPTSDPSFLCYLMNGNSLKISKMENDGSYKLCDYQPFIEAKLNKGTFLDAVHIGGNEFYYVDQSKTGKSIFRINKENDSIQINEVFNLALNPKLKSPFAYIGEFAINAKKDRMAYAYKYFKILKFMDLKANAVKTINFEKETFEENTLYRLNGLDANVTHYWDVCARNKYVYFLYSGRTPYDVTKEHQKKNFYIFVEQYDWNGNPIRKFKLDQWGKITINEEETELYLVSYLYDEPLFRYQLPPIE